MKRIAILGCSGSGKSTLAARLAKLVDLPLIHLDQHFHRPDWKARPPEEWAYIHAELIARDRWIIDGCYGGSATARTQRADMIIWFDLPTHVCLYRVVKRIITGCGKRRFDAAPGCRERFDLEFLLYVLSFRRRKAPRLLKILEDRPVKTELVIICNNADIEMLLSRFKTPRSASKTSPENAL